MFTGVALAVPAPEADSKADPQVLLSYPYSVYGYPYGYRYIGKRSADAEPEAEAKADSQVLLTYPYSMYGYPYGYRYIGKRSADAEPAADAKAQFYYSGFPYYTYPYAFGK
jgi:hypothetical protein